MCVLLITKGHCCRHSLTYSKLCCDNSACIECLWYEITWAGEQLKAKLILKLDRKDNWVLLSGIITWHRQAPLFGQSPTVVIHITKDCIQFRTLQLYQKLRKQFSTLLIVQGKDRWKLPAFICGTILCTFFARSLPRTENQKYDREMLRVWRRILEYMSWLCCNNGIYNECSFGIMQFGFGLMKSAMF